LNIAYKFEDNIALPSEIIDSAGLRGLDKIECNKINNSYIIRITAIIGKQAHPMIKIAGYTSWYSDGKNGYYITGYDIEKNDFFQIIS
jgi:aspartate 1-decarboxylase